MTDARRLTLPPRPGFSGRIGTTYLDSEAAFDTSLRAPEGAPNVLVVLLDDVGFGQCSAFGGPVETPTLDKLAGRGLRYTRFHTTAMCSPTRASILTGRNHHAVANGAIVEWATGFPGYNTALPATSATIAEILRLNGYSTAAFGKWHNTPEWEAGPAGPFDRWPTGLGFEHFYGFIGTDCDQFHPTLYRNTTLLEDPSSPDYILDADLAEQAIRWLKRQRSIASDKPFFLWFATGTAHSPLHAPTKWIERYAGRFDEGWDRQREITIERQKQMGIVPAQTRLTPRPDAIPAWKSLTSEQRKLYARYQEVFAGAVSHCDMQIGRVLHALEELGISENTLVLFVVGDNGPSAEGGLQGSFNKFATWNGIAEPEHSLLARLSEIGSHTSYCNYPVGWAFAGATPFPWFKQIASHLGGTRNGLVVSWPKRILAAGGLRSQFHHCCDIAPTILEATGLPAPSTVRGIEQARMDGVSMCGSFAEASGSSPRTVQYFELVGNRAVFDNGWMASARHGRLPWEYAGSANGDFSSDVWELYDLESDFSQAIDLAGKMPEKLAALQTRWHDEAMRNGVYPLDDRRAPRMGAATAALRPPASRYEFSSPDVRLPEALSPNLKGKSHRIECYVTYRTGDRGVLVACGGRFGGYSLFVKDGRLWYAHNLCGVELFVIQSEPLEEGEQMLGCEFKSDEPRLGCGGSMALLSNRSVIGAGRIPKTVPLRYSWAETFDVGKDAGTAVCDEYASPYEFTGTFRKAVVEILSSLSPAESAREANALREATFHNQ